MDPMRSSPAQHIGIARADSLGERLASTLRDRIVRGDIPAGTHLIEDVVAQTYDVSRGPVRDALKLLKLDNLVEPQRRGFHVVGLAAADVHDLYAVRHALESLAITSAIAMLGRRPRTTMDDAMRGMTATARPELSHEFAGHDLRFHRGIYEASGNRRLLALWENIEPLFASMLAVTNREDTDLTPVARDHDLLREAITAGDASRALSILTDHLKGSERRMSQALQRIWDITLRDIT